MGKKSYEGRRDFGACQKENKESGVWLIGKVGEGWQILLVQSKDITKMRCSGRPDSQESDFAKIKNGWEMELVGFLELSTTSGL